MDDSIVVIQCAASKQPDAGYLQAGNGRKVMFVAQPDLAPENADYIYTRPDGQADTGLSWRQELLGYNREPADNPLGLLPAWRLYKNPSLRAALPQIRAGKPLHPVGRLGSNPRGLSDPQLRHHVHQRQKRRQAQATVPSVTNLRIFVCCRTTPTRR